MSLAWKKFKNSEKFDFFIVAFSYLAVRFSDWQALYPLLCIGAVFGFQDESAIISKDLESLGDITSTFFGHFYRPYGAHVQSLGEGRMGSQITTWRTLEKYAKS